MPPDPRRQLQQATEELREANDRRAATFLERMNAKATGRGGLIEEYPRSGRDRMVRAVDEAASAVPPAPTPRPARRTPSGPSLEDLSEAITRHEEAGMTFREALHAAEKELKIMPGTPAANDERARRLFDGS